MIEATQSNLLRILMRLLERQIRQSPADWFWVHNRWKTPWPSLLIAGTKARKYFSARN